ncbi:hypothetical protein [Cupriavidus campinensis]|uniref:Uncharacterized protein n=1 Tax=Cupriavidus campinensis TaxID=151783 RepID=A0ABY3ESK9_9BURK|nr:hypothetical protein [Cupriavidus campinensis]TSP13927.1 hypothetical protein FGG12_05475 [Cupriavidus campinensis]
MVVDFFVLLLNAPKAMGLGFFGTLAVMSGMYAWLDEGGWRTFLLSACTALVAVCVYSAIRYMWMAAFGDFVEIQASGGMEQIFMPLKANAVGSMAGIGAFALIRRMFA